MEAIMTISPLAFPPSYLIRAHFRDTQGGSEYTRLKSSLKTNKKRKNNLNYQIVQSVFHICIIMSYWSVFLSQLRFTNIFGVHSLIIQSV